MRWLDWVSYEIRPPQRALYLISQVAVSKSTMSSSCTRWVLFLFYFLLYFTRTWGTYYDHLSQIEEHTAHNMNMSDCFSKFNARKTKKNTLIAILTLRAIKSWNENANMERRDEQRADEEAKSSKKVHHKKREDLRPKRVLTAPYKHTSCERSKWLESGHRWCKKL